MTPRFNELTQLQVFGARNMFDFFGPVTGLMILPNVSVITLGGSFAPVFPPVLSPTLSAMYARFFFPL
jgi:hypothetical protein